MANILESTFAEEFHSVPRYASSPDENLGFWVKVSKGNLVVGSGPLPRALGEPDQLTFGDYRPTLPVGRTVNAAMSEDDQQSQAGYSKSAFQYDKESERPVIQQSSPLERARCQKSYHGSLHHYMTNSLRGRQVNSQATSRPSFHQLGLSARDLIAKTTIQKAG